MLVICDKIAIYYSIVCTQGPQNSRITNASCKNARPKVYCVSFVALNSGKYRVLFGTNGKVARRSKLAYGRTISTVGPFSESPTVKVKLGLLAINDLWSSSSTVYMPINESQISPKFCSNFRHASRGRYRYGTVESININIEYGSKDSVNPSDFLEMIECKTTTRSRDWSGAR